jgi:hypothetical protein
LFVQIDTRTLKMDLWVAVLIALAAPACALINWEILQAGNLDQLELEGFEENNQPWMMPGVASRPEYVDETVPLDLLQPLHEAVLEVLANPLAWLETERREWPRNADRMYLTNCKQVYQAACCMHVAWSGNVRHSMASCHCQLSTPM